MFSFLPKLTLKSGVVDYKIKGYTTHIQAANLDEDIVRIVVLTKDNSGVKISLRPALMQESYPSIWIEIQHKRFKSNLTHIT